MASIENPTVNTGSSSATTQSRKQIGDLLVLQGSITAEQLADAQVRQRESADGRTPVENILLKLGSVTEEDITRARAAMLGMGYASPDTYGPQATIAPEVLAIVPPGTALANNIMPVGRTPDGKALRIVSGHWTQSSFNIAKSLTVEYGLRPEPMLGNDKLVRAAIKAYYPNAEAEPVGRSAVPAVLETKSATPAKIPPSKLRASDVLSAVNAPTVVAQANRTGDADQDVDIQEFSVDQPIIIQFVNKIIADAINRRASDIHCEPAREKLIIKYRIDGTLHTIDEVPKSFQAACASRLKVMADMNIAERRVPQDGRIAVRIMGRVVDMRVSSLPTQYGEAIVMRILDRTSMRLDIDHLGFSERNLRTLKSLITKPHGIFLATGPTGSGKTTTLYSCIHAIHSPEINIITVEDPIEYELDGVRQSNVNEKAGLTFAKQLRAILRQDPDIIYVGEIRDPETAEIAFRAALTGHLVFSTLHCNDAASAVTRLLNMGMDPFLIASSVIGVLAQRLVRKVCEECAQPYTPLPEELHAFGIEADSMEVRHSHARKGAGCPTCDKTGYAGRYTVQELMVMDDSVRQLTLESAPSSKIRTAAITSSNNPMIPMRRDGSLKVLEGITTFEEVQRRVFIEEE